MEAHLRIQTLLEFLHNDREDASTKYMLALEYIKSGDVMEAFKWMQEIYIQHPEYLPNYYHFGKLLERISKLEMAEKIYEAGIQTALEQKNMHAMRELKSALESMEENRGG